jgi:hypothetical protein
MKKLFLALIALMFAALPLRACPVAVAFTPSVCYQPAVAIAQVQYVQPAVAFVPQIQYVAAPVAVQLPAVSYQAAVPCPTVAFAQEQAVAVPYASASFAAFNSYGVNAVAVNSYGASAIAVGGRVRGFGGRFRGGLVGSSAIAVNAGGVSVAASGARSVRIRRGLLGGTNVRVR